MNPQEIENEFLKDVKDHEMTVNYSDGVIRNISFKSKHDNFIYAFTLSTWPGHLCITGDYGTYVFRANLDMFAFFDTDKINPDYWSEKLIATDIYKGHKEYSFKTFKENVETYIQYNWEFKNKEQEESVRAKLYNKVFSSHDVIDNAHDAYKAIDNFVYYGSDEPGWGNTGLGISQETKPLFQFDNFYEYDSNDYTYSYLWCLYAIKWGVGKFRRKRERNDYLEEKKKKGENIYYSHFGTIEDLEKYKKGVLDKLKDFTAYDYEKYSRGEQEDFDYIYTQDILLTDDVPYTHGFETSIMTFTDCTGDKSISKILRVVD